MPQNVYDNPEFFQRYRDLRQNDTGLNGALEVPAFQKLLPSLVGLQILDLGCGFGEFARYGRSQGAAYVEAIDVSEKMVAEARSLTADDKINFMCRSIESHSPEIETFDLVTSSMALHYISDYKAVVQTVWRCLVQGGMFVFSVEHPSCTANPVGWIRDEDGTALHWPLDRYQSEGERRTSWFIEGVTKYHRTVETYVNTLIEQGFQLTHLGEPKPLDGHVSRRPWLLETLKRPPVLLLAAKKT
ncbi:hypothetical protein PV08_02562 [Exophiala spinifera]|uniref:Methyltransferase type 11 domain-containing protein n=1 Tax=Exophiala spinifera TaxID=91928 RepID=A0A0D2C3Q3_9EURO|nr:uncharacterized protein PV08_02562 [Exophiala spinifera]KIW18274.1 hypothetical protein PV08_02562 [Exophiala spinifera]